MVEERTLATNTQGRGMDTHQFLPEKAYDDVALVIQHSEHLHELYDFLHQCSLPIKETDLESNLAEKTGIAIDTLSRIINTLQALHRARNYLELSGVAFVERLAVWFRDIASDRDDHTRIQDLDKAMEAIREALDEDSELGMLEKTFELAFSHQNVLKDARIFTDIRPVYNKDATEIRRMTVTHQLVLEYLNGSGENARLHIAADASDIHKLERLCERARRKSLILAEELGKQGWPTFVIGEYDE